MKSLKTKYIAIFLLFLVCAPAFAQRTENFKSPQYEFNTAIDLFLKEKYGTAQKYFQYVYENTGDRQQDLKTNSYFYMGVCAAKNNNYNTGFLLQNFIDRYPVHSHVSEAHYYLGRFYFSQKQYKKTIAQFDNLYENEIQPENIAEYRFKKGYSYFKTGEPEKAKALFKQAAEQTGPYQLRSIYYLSFLAYEDGNYEAALEGFLQLKDEPEYQKEIPQYLTQIYFSQGQYEKVIELAPTDLDPKDAGQAQILRCVALAEYNLNEYEAAAAHFDQLENANKIEFQRNDWFAMGFTYYRVLNYDKAIQYFSKAIDDENPDFMTQNAYYIIADCYRKNGNSALAIQSFKEAAKYDFNADIKEDALFNYAKLQYQNSTSSFNNGIKALEEYIETYPHSARSEEATIYLSKIYLSTKNYEAAIKSMDKLSRKSPEVLRAYQRCTYFRALELINNQQYKKAITLLEKAQTAPIDKDMNFSTLYWKGEAQYRDKQYKDAYYTLQNYLKSKNVKDNDFYVNALYTTGYAALKTKRYEDAITYFKRFLSMADEQYNVEIQADATARLGDCYFMRQDLNKAIKYYDQCERLGQSNADYALYQLAKCYGYQKRLGQKVETLDRLTNNFPQSSYLDDADFELAITYHSQNEYYEAIDAYKRFIIKHPRSNYIRQVHNRLAQAYLNTDQVEMAISTYKYVVETYPGSQEAKDALANLENIYTEQGNTSEFFEYIRSKNMNISVDRQDSIAFKAAESKYNRGDCERSIPELQEYLSEFPNGLFVAKAHFYKGECEYGMRRYKEALADYEAIIENYRTEFNVTALHKAASILYNDKNYTKALDYFSKLLENTTAEEEVIFGNNGVMHCAYFLQKYPEAYQAALNVIEIRPNDQDLYNEALLIAGNSANFNNDFANAKTYYTRLIGRGSNDLCAEAAYWLADISLNQDHDQKACEEQIQAILGGNYSSEYWYARTFILYGDLYKAKGNYFQAKHTYQSIVDNYGGEDLVQMAQEKIAEVEALEIENPSNE